VTKTIYRRFRSLTIEEEKEKFGFSETEEMIKEGCMPTLSLLDPTLFLSSIDEEIEY